MHAPSQDSRWSLLSGVDNQAPWLAADLWALLGIAKQVLPSRLADAGHAQTLHNNCVLYTPVAAASCNFPFPQNEPDESNSAVHQFISSPSFVIAMDMANSSIKLARMHNHTWNYGVYG